MLSAEGQRFPHWAEQERGRDLAWIAENLHVFWPAAQRGFRESGRGALVVDITTLVKHERGESNPFIYLPSGETERHRWEDIIRMVRSYDPSWEFVAVVLKGDRESAYQVGVPL